MENTNEQYNLRKQKLKNLKEKNINPYPYSYDKKHNTKDIQKEFSKLKKQEKTNKKKKIAGRIMTSRVIGKIAFITIQDQSGKIQLFASQDNLEKEKYKQLTKLDLGDIIGVEGAIFKTKTGEITLDIKNYELLSKSLRPMPSKWHGLKDEEEKLRKRYLDIISNPEIKELFIKKQKFWNTIRNFLIKKEFLEVETPILEISAGGAAATPFKTHHNALNTDIFLRISMGELWQKKLLVAGYEKTFEIGRQFRNEGIDAEHLQDYTQMEFYWAYADYKMGMELVKEMYKEVVKEVLGTLKFETNNHKINLNKKWELYDYETLIKEKTKINIYKHDKKDIIKFLDKKKIKYDPKVDKWRLIDILWKYCRKDISGPGFLVGQPVEITPLAKRSRKDNKKVEQFQVIMAGSEMGNGYSELNDPEDQKERFERQMKLKKAGDKESMEHDKSFVEALEYGMPPACGFGVSERFFSVLMNKPIRECVIFPLMKPKNQ
jgi:lysyl-tRNA synthetase class 2|tara:strand:- start:80 stop:1549 length:1470 start_codon:yes stop_codon:yes gene_type:complete